MEPLVLYVYARHFRWADFDNNMTCALAKAAKEQFRTDSVFEKVDQLRIGAHYYWHERYEYDRHRADHRKAKKRKFNDSLMFFLELIPVKK